MSRCGTVIETFTGRYLDFLAPMPSQVCVEDIARGLSMTCRFSGQVSRFYSVAEHATRVADDVFERTSSYGLAFAALHHDSHEAYMTDWPSPLKQALGNDFFNSIADDIDEAIARAFGIRFEDFKHHEIKDADERALRDEASVLKRSRGVGSHWNNHSLPEITIRLDCLDPSDAEADFLLQHHLLTKLAAKDRQCLPT